MMNRMSKFCFGLSLICLASFLSCGYFDSVVSPVESASATLSGRVVDSLSGQGLSGVRLTLNGVRDTVVWSATDGQFTFSVAKTGEKRLSASYDGYHSWSVSLELQTSENRADLIRLVRANHAPRLWKMLYPVSHASAIPLTLSFRWLVGDADLGKIFSAETLFYRFQLSTQWPPMACDSGFINPDSCRDTLMQNSPALIVYEPDTLFTDLFPGTRYYWRVSVHDVFGDSAVLGADSFTTRSALSAVCPDSMVLVEMETLTFCIDSYEFTNRAYMEFDTNYTVDSFPRFSRTFDSPISDIDYTHAQAACESVGKRLCHIREWQAASGGYRRLSYPYGNEYNPYRCHTDVDANDMARDSTLPVGSKDSCVSPYGVYDLSGNIAEWVAPIDAFPPFSGKDGAKLFYFTGGYWASQSKSGTYDLYATTEEKGIDIGFRCCKTIH
ncbi:MAG: hypothetical protein A2293_08170 [Elusimicrobia bacterium RIFOXYB2_FULL_49_7]|nr:MAG: hypothetical protein A2293_08170 [Elusimicrobia bacterium RIFOXYB2_FULL_49_7]